MSTYYSKATVVEKDSSVGFEIAEVRDNYDTLIVPRFYLAVFTELKQNTERAPIVKQLCDIANAGQLHLVRDVVNQRFVNFRCRALNAITGHNIVLRLPSGKKTKLSDIAEIYLHPSTDCTVALEVKRPMCSCERVGASFCGECGGQFCV